MSSSIPLTVEFTGGLEMLFSNERKHKISVPSTKEDGAPSDIAFLVRYLCDNVMKDTRKDLFLLDGSVRPGILVLINDADWELEGEE
ncbi:Ubiquitin- modifier 1, partial [Ascosphaera atra]